MTAIAKNQVSNKYISAEPISTKLEIIMKTTETTTIYKNKTKTNSTTTNKTSTTTIFLGCDSIEINIVHVNFFPK